jgi:hypothetical protein
VTGPLAGRRAIVKVLIAPFGGQKTRDDRGDLLGAFEHHQMAAPGNDDQLRVREETPQDARVSTVSSCVPRPFDG